MKRLTKTIALLVVLALLCGSYFFVQKSTQTAQVTEEAGTFALTDQTVSDLVGISWTDDGTTYHFVKEEDLWLNADDETFPTDQDAVQALADDLTALEANRKLEDIESIADYGLDMPTFIVTSEWSDGSSTEYSMGDETPFADGYYLKLSGDDTVIYTVESSLSTLFSCTLLDLAKQEEIPTVEQATRLTVGTTLDVTYTEISTTLDRTQNWYSTASGEALDDDAVETLIAAAQDISWNELLTASATGAELTSWNLTNDVATVLTVYEEENATFTLLIGATDDSGNYYARLSDSTMVYTVTSDSIIDLLEADVSDLQSSVLVPLDFTDLAKAEFTLNEQTFAYQRTETVVNVEATEDTGETATTEVNVTLNGETTDSAAAESLWNLVSDLSISTRTDITADGEVILSINATNDSGISASYDFFEHDANSYLVQTSDGINILTPADSIDQLIRNLRQLN